MPTIDFNKQSLKILKVKDNIDFKKDITVTLEFENFMLDKKVKLDWYPKVQIESSFQRKTEFDLSDQETHNLTEKHLAFIDWDEVFFALQKFKNERTWYNLSIPKDNLQEIMSNANWYDLYIPEDALEPDRFEKVFIWQEIVIALLKGYIDKVYNTHKSNYLGKHMETLELTPDHPNFIYEYELAVEESQKDIIDKLTKLKNLLDKGQFDEELKIGRNFTAFEFLQHLYKPLLYLDEKQYRDVVKISPVPLNHGEMLFVNDLKRFYKTQKDSLNGKKLFLLRNQSRQGVGFFEAHGFFPDFILWVIDDNMQHIAFIDPKGLRQVTGFDHPKMRFYKTIKEEIEPRIDDQFINLNSFIISMTPHRDLKHWKGQDGMKDFNDKHVFFRHEQEAVYISKMIDKMASYISSNVD
jgi:hypothetical protein